jgi:UDP-GlcNAc:undecaprenyl-phosphate GlcNAc-1-phosphate transferase
MNWLIFAGIAIEAFFITWLIVPVVRGMLVDAGFVRLNYRKEEIPLAMGLVFFLSALIVVTFCRVFNLMGPNAYIFLFAIGAMGFFGLIDDVFGTRQASGLKGHFNKLFIEREMSTGALKALVGGMIGLMVSIEYAEGTGINKIAFLVMNTLIIALSTNTINLLDLRPGRAGKSFFVLSLFIVAVGADRYQLMYLAVMGGSLAAFLPFDLKANAMMGDTGSNMLGMTIGFLAVYNLALPVKLAFFLFLLVFHLVTEKYSLTSIIEKNRVLNYLDMIGRR